MRSPVAEVLQVKKTDISRHGVWVLAAAMLLALGACSNDKKPEETTGGSTGPLKIDSVIFEPKVAAPGDTLLFTAVVTSSGENAGDFPVYEWSANGGTLLETNKQSVRWASPNASGVYTLTCKATNDVNSTTNKGSVFIGTGENLVTGNAGQVDLIGTGPNFHFLRSLDIKLGVDISNYDYGSHTATDAVPPQIPNGAAVAYSGDGLWAAYQTDTTLVGIVGKARNLYLADFSSQTANRFTSDGSRPGSAERNLYNQPSFSPNSEVIAYQRLAQSWDAVATDSFHVYIYDRVQQKRTKVTYEWPYPRGFFPTFSTDSKWLVYVLDVTRTGAWELYGSPMTGNTVDGSIAATVRMTNTGGAIMSGAPRELKRPPMAWNPVMPILAFAGADNVLYLVQTTSTGSNVIPVTEVQHANEVAWSADGSKVAASYWVTENDEVHYKVATITAAGVVTVRATALVGDLLRDLAFSPDGQWLLYRVTRGGSMWFNIVDTGAGKLTEPVAVTPADPIGLSNDYHNIMSLRPAWTSANLMIYPAFGTSANNTAGIWVRSLAGVIN